MVSFSAACEARFLFVESAARDPNPEGTPVPRRALSRQKRNVNQCLETSHLCLETHI